MRGGNLGATRQRLKARRSDPMACFDNLPQPLRHWLAEAALPWSPISCRRLWERARREGANDAEALAVLDYAQSRALQRERTES